MHLENTISPAYCMVSYIQIFFFDIGVLNFLCQLLLLVI
jgi:hypothetical protein